MVPLTINSRTIFSIILSVAGVLCSYAQAKFKATPPLYTPPQPCLSPHYPRVCVDRFWPFDLDNIKMDYIGDNMRVYALFMPMGDYEIVTFYLHPEIITIKTPAALILGNTKKEGDEVYFYPTMECGPEGIQPITSCTFYNLPRIFTFNDDYALCSYDFTPLINEMESDESYPEVLKEVYLNTIASMKKMQKIKWCRVR